VININCVLDYYFQTSKSFSIYDQVVTKSEHLTELSQVQDVVTTLVTDSNEFQQMKA
jgi:hypothetical protein